MTWALWNTSGDVSPSAERTVIPRVRCWGGPLDGQEHEVTSWPLFGSEGSGDDRRLKSVWTVAIPDGEQDEQTARILTGLNAMILLAMWGGWAQR